MSAQRDENLKRLSDDGRFDVVVVGGGINGIGVYRELALQGLRVLLVERRDFCSGCSAAPSRMIHGGLRYLENGEFALVRESLRERDALLANAPHMVRPLPTTIPIMTTFSGLRNGIISFLGQSARPSRRGALPIKVGLTLYDWVTRTRRVLPKHRFRGANATKKKWPELTDGLRYSATYFDAWISHPERLGLELILDTMRMAPGSIALNYAELRPDGAGFTVMDCHGKAEFRVRAKVVVNATGAWLDQAIAEVSGTAPTAEPLVSGTKGSHLIIRNAALYDALAGHMMYFENSDGRVCIVFPYLGNVLAGSTDIRVETVERVRCEPDEQAYILTSLQRIFPGISVEEDQILFSYSGIRPLPVSDHDFTGRISRGHFVHKLDGAVPQFCMVGGKWTTFRAFSEQAADLVLEHLGSPRQCGTHDLAIGGGAGFPISTAMLVANLSKDFATTSDRAAHLVDAYGTRATQVLAFCQSRTDDQALDAGLQITAAEIGFLAQHEHVETLSDIVLRRTSLAITGTISLGLIKRISGILAQELGWNDSRRRTEEQHLIDELNDFHGVSPETLEQRTKDRSLICA